MRTAGHTQRDAARGSADDHTLIGVGYVVSHLFHAARGDERRIGAYIRMQARGRQAGCRADRVLFGDAQFDETVAKAFDVKPDAEHILGIGGHDHRARFTRADLEQGLAEGEARLIGGSGAPFGGNRFGSVHGCVSLASPPNSSRAFA